MLLEGRHLRGFSLIEVVIAMVIFAIGVIGVFNVTPFLSGTSERARTKTEESMLIHQVMANIKIYMSRSNQNNFNWVGVGNYYTAWRRLDENRSYEYKVKPTETVGYDTYLRQFEIQLRTPGKGKLTEKEEKSFFVYISR